MEISSWNSNTMLEQHVNLSNPEVESVQDLVVLDLMHRLKNIYAVVGGVLALSARAKPEMRPFVEALRDRIAALEAAHAYLVETPAATEEERTVMGLLRLLIAPFNSETVKTITVSGCDAPMTWGPGGTLALIVRELATNSVKYGALSAETGHIEIACSEDRGGYAIRWRETGGPRMAGPPEATGFGTRLIERAAALAGFSVEREWRVEGLESVIVIPAAELTR
jgi:two-component sensor histidine kinase